MNRRPHTRLRHTRRPHSRLSVVCLTAALLASAAEAQSSFSWGQRNTDLEPASADQFRAPLAETPSEVETSVVATGLKHPWGIEVLPDGAGYIVTERPGALRYISMDGTVSAPIAGVPEVVAVRQGGLLDVALAPDFADSRLIYLSYAKRVGSGDAATSVYRARLSEDHSTLEEGDDIFVQEPAVPAPLHYGSRIVFDPDGFIYITTGDRGFPQFSRLAQDIGTSIGKVIRLAPDGSVPDDNPFDGTGPTASVYSLGHRNIQGAAFQGETLWTIEHGPKGGDELNQPQPGKNYGWPVVSYGENYNGRPVGDGVASAPEFEEPVYFWDPVIAPGGIHFYDGDLFPDWQGDLLIASLRPGGVVRLTLEGGRVVGEERVLHRFSRVRDIEVDADGSVLILTDEDDGAVVRITPAD
ncbi:MAG: PQQ-dependent sugar dehydrogenase [Pseudomonadota bacterium]